MKTKKEKYLQLKHDLLSSCGQCMGFRARGAGPESEQAGAPCSPGLDCHRSCPALGLGGPPAAAREVPAGLTPGQAAGNGPESAGKAPPLHEGAGEKDYIQSVACGRCGQKGGKAVLIPYRHKGRSLWACTGCLPALIHG